MGNLRQHEETPYVVVEFPTEDSEDWQHWGYFKTRQEAVAALREAGYDVTDDGSINLIDDIL